MDVELMADLKALKRELADDPVLAFVRDEHQSTLLHHAVALGRAKAIPLLLKTGALVEARDQEGKTPLAIAASKGNEVIAALLLDAGASPNALDAAGTSPLLVAARAGKTALCRLLVHKGGVLAQAKDVEQGKTDADKALLRSAERVFRYRWARTWKKAPWEASSVLGEARNDADFAAALRLDAVGVAILKDAAEELPALLQAERGSFSGDWAVPARMIEWAVLAQSPKSMEWLLANPKLTPEGDRSFAMALAVELRQPKTIAFLIEHDARPPLAQELTAFPFEVRNQLLTLGRQHAAYRGWDSPAFQLLSAAEAVRAGLAPPAARTVALAADPRYLVMAKRPLPDTLDVQRKDNAGCTLLHYAAAAGNLEVARMLLERGSPSVNDAGCTSLGYDPLKLALSARARELALLLVEKGAASGKTNWIYYALTTGNPDAAMAVARKSSPAELGKMLDAAVWWNAAALVRHILDVAPPAPTPDGDCKLAKRAAMHGSNEALTVLLDQGAPLDGPCGSLLVAALDEGRLGTALLLAKRGADPSATDWAPLRLALKRGAREVVRELAAKRPEVAERARAMEVEASAGGFLEYLAAPKNPNACLEVATSPALIKHLLALPGATAGVGLKGAIDGDNLDALKLLLGAGVRATPGDVVRAFRRGFAIPNVGYSTPMPSLPDDKATKQALAAVTLLLASRTWTGDELDVVLGGISGPTLFPSSLFGELLRKRQALAPAPSTKVQGEIAARAHDADLALLTAAYPAGLTAETLWQEAIEHRDDARAELHVKANPDYPKAKLNSLLQHALDWGLPQTSALIVERLADSEQYPGFLLAKAFRAGTGTAARLLFASPDALTEESMLAAVAPERAWLLGVLLERGVEDPKGKVMEALLKLGDGAANRRLVARLLVRGPSIESMLLNAGRTEYVHELGEYFLATLAPFDEEGAEPTPGIIMSDLVAALAARKKGLALVSELVERLDAPLDLQEPGGYGVLPLWSALREGEPEIVGYLLDNHVATIAGCSEAIDVLVERKLPGKRAIKALLDKANVASVGICAD